MSVWTWDKIKIDVSLGLAEGRTIVELARENKLSERTINRWNLQPEFSEEVDRLTLMIGIASRAERLRIVKQLVRERITGAGGKIPSDKDLLDWLKFAQSETDGIRLGLTTFAEATGLLAEPGQD